MQTFTVVALIVFALVYWGAICWILLVNDKKFIDVDNAMREKAERLKSLSHTQLAKDDLAQFVKDFGRHCKANRCYPESNYAIVEFKGSHYVGHSIKTKFSDEFWIMLGVYPKREDAYSLILDLYIPF